MKKLVKILNVVLVVVLSVAMLTACGGKDTNTDKEKNSSKSDYANMTVDDLLKDIKDPQNVTLDEFVALVSTLSNVEITEDLELEENITIEAINKLSDDGAEFPPVEEYVEPLLKNEAPQVRGYAISCINSLTGVSDANIAAAKEMLKNEKDPYVICCAVKALANEGGSDAEIGQFLLDAAKNENSKIRKQAALALGSSWNKDLDGAVDAMITLMNDSDKDVRSMAYEYAGKLADERIIEPIVAMLKDPSLAEFHGNGVKSLVTMWYDYPFHENTSEAAYKATMDYLRTTPVTDKVPDWIAVGSFYSKADSSYDEWRAKATYFDPNEIAEVMTNILKNPDANWNARSAAIKTMAAHCSKETFNALKPVVDGLTDSKAKYLQDEYNTEAEKLNA